MSLVYRLRYSQVSLVYRLSDSKVSLVYRLRDSQVSLVYRLKDSQVSHVYNPKIPRCLSFIVQDFSDCSPKQVVWGGEGGTYNIRYTL